MSDLPIVPRNGSGGPPANAALELLERIDRRLQRLERILDEGFGALLSAKFPYGDQRTSDRWGRGRR